MNKVNTGHVSNKAYGTRIRQVEMTRGNRQGNNAFADVNFNASQVPSIQFGKNMTRILRNLSIDFFKAYKLCRDKFNEYDDNFTVR